MPLFAWIVALSLTIGVPVVHAQSAQIAIVQPAEATTIDPGRSTREVIVYGTSKRVTFRPRPDFRLIVSEMSLGRAGWPLTGRRPRAPEVS